jgi:hypothetical protein
MPLCVKKSTKAVGNIVLMKIFPDLKERNGTSISTPSTLLFWKPDHATLYFLNLHNRDVAHIPIQGETGSGKAFLKKYVRKVGPGRQMDLPLSA